MAQNAIALSTQPYVTTYDADNNVTNTVQRIQISWSAASNFGGSTLAYYSLQVSTDGINWVTWANTTALTWSANRPAAGTTLKYRVITVSSVGMTSASAPIFQAP
mgnify:CR=1 FL=1